MGRAPTFLALAAAIVLLSWADPAPLAGPEVRRGQVLEVIDGDGLRLDTAAGAVSIRIWGVDAPDRVAEGSRAARAFLEGLVLGRGLACEKKGENPPTARYPRPRVVALCRLDGHDVAVDLLEAGHAKRNPKYDGGHYKGIERQIEEHGQ